jgi:hypothetical protein
LRQTAQEAWINELRNSSCNRISWPVSPSHVSVLSRLRGRANAQARWRLFDPSYNVSRMFIAGCSRVLRAPSGARGSVRLTATARHTRCCALTNETYLHVSLAGSQ